MRRTRRSRPRNRLYPRRARSRPAPTCCAWISPTAASPTRCSTTRYWAPDDPQRNPYDDTGWTFGELFNVKVVRVTDAKVLEAPLELVKGELTAAGSVTGTGSLFAINHNADPSLATLRYRFKDAQIDVAEEPFEAEGQKFNRGSFIIRGGVSAEDLGKAVADLGLKAVALAAAPSVKTHPAKAARIALMHTWINTQDEGWWRLALDQIAVPFDYISTQDVAEGRRISDPSTTSSSFRRSGAAPASRSSRACRCTAIPCRGRRPSSRRTSARSIRPTTCGPGMGWQGLANLQKFVRDGGVLITVDDTSNFAIQFGFTAGVSVTPAQRLKITGAVLRSKVVDGASPIAYGYDETLSIYSSDGPIFGVSNTLGGRGGRGGAAEPRRATGRGTPDEPDQPQGRPPSDPLPPGPEGRTLAGDADSGGAAPQRHQHHPAGTAAARGVPLRRRTRPARLRPARRRRRDRAAADGRRRARSTRGTWSSSRTTRSGAARRTAATSWC